MLILIGVTNYHTLGYIDYLNCNSIINPKLNSDSTPISYITKGYSQRVNFTKDGDSLVEVMPEFPGGLNALNTFISNNFKYPKKARKKLISGSVIVKFIVTKTGEIDSVSIQKSIDPLLDDEAIRVIKLLPNWKPGTANSKPVNVIMSLPILFQLPD
jgi:TonB family protein